ncbi:hypothetical protein [Streptomyces sp. NPDC056600]|uniref:hypothetical protein n=1 Tax=Streptomyces sp. NPDC056600 TaxID=3345874 RepID=UPI00368E56C3
MSTAPTTAGLAPARLALHVAVPPLGTSQGAVECRPVVDGRDLLAGVFDKGPAEDPGRLLGPDSPLFATGTPRRVRIAEAECSEGCCGAVYVTVRREGGQVVRSDWRDPDDASFTLPELRFALDQYEAEIRRASADHRWEWPARTVARLLEERLRGHADRPGRFACELGSVSAWHREPDRITLLLFHPGRSALREGRPWLRFRLALPVTDEAPADQVPRLEDLLTAEDPRRAGDVCGGSREFAEALGYSWPGR